MTIVSASITSTTVASSASGSGWEVAALAAERSVVSSDVLSRWSGHQRPESRSAPPSVPGRSV
jgi:hypothetical protein